MPGKAKFQVQVTALGQVGYRFQFGSITVYVDPYLTDYVANQYGTVHKRQVAAPILPADVKDANWVFITHAHADHADPTTLGPLACSSPQARFVATYESVPILEGANISSQRIELANEGWTSLGEGLTVRTIPAAHTQLERDEMGNLRYAGYLFNYQDRLIYHAGDTIPHREIIEAIQNEGAVEVAFLPVNERNYYRDALQIVGNMSLREALEMAEEIRTKTLVPTHWDLFPLNSTYREEVEWLYNKLKPPFHLNLIRCGETAVL